MAALVDYQDYRQGGHAAHAQSASSRSGPPRISGGDARIQGSGTSAGYACGLSRVLNGKSGISAAMALRLAAAMGTTPELWMNMQPRYDLWRARKARPSVVRKLAHVAARLNSYTP